MDRDVKNNEGAGDGVEEICPSDAQRDWDREAEWKRYNYNSPERGGREIKIKKVMHKDILLER